ncbi:hypothetical protein [Sorangium sp. So ce1389]|uniref:hypothetical protein n=1 Tax=Sorangium sp. So ce1389 TaxID=3133336 RepID=UPI003F603C03
MPRRPTGSLFRNAADRLYVRVLVGDSDRESFPLDPKLTEQQAEQRKERVADLAARLRASRNVTRDATVALLERAAVREGWALRDVIEAMEVVCRGGAQAKVVPGGGSVPKQVTLQQFGELWTSGELARMYPDHVKPKRISPGVPQALRAWLALRGNPAPSAPLFVNEEGDRFGVEHAAERFRAHLQLAGIDRPELFEDSDERQQVRAHDTRSTFITPSPSRTAGARPGSPTGLGTGARS